MKRSMALCRLRNIHRARLALPQSSLHLRPFNIPTYASCAVAALTNTTTQQPPELFGYTSGRWIYNELRRLAERRRLFNVEEFKRLAAESVNREVKDILRFEKLAECGFNRVFLITMRDGFKLIGRIPYPQTQPTSLLVASEVATMEYLRSKGIPVPQIYGYSISEENTAGTEHIFMELVPGISLDIAWDNLTNKDRTTVIRRLVELESQLFALNFPAGGSIYYKRDLEPGVKSVELPMASSSSTDDFCIGPDVSPELWYGKRSRLQTERGPYLDSLAALTAGAQKELKYLTKFGRPLHPICRTRRESHNYQKQNPTAHIDNLEKYLKVAPSLIPFDNKSLLRQTLRHPDLRPSNVFVSESLEITGLIGWQHCAILPLFLQCSVPSSFRNCGDPVSESMDLPKLPEDFTEMNEENQLEQIVILRKRQIYYSYVTATEEINPLHYEAMMHDLSHVRLQAFREARHPWQGDNVTLKFLLTQVVNNWPALSKPSSESAVTVAPPCPITFSEEEVEECLRLSLKAIEADDLEQLVEDIVGVADQGWVLTEFYDEVKERARKFKEEALKCAESDEVRQKIREHWIFDDFDEDEYA